MIDIQLDWATAATILGSVTSFAAFMYGIFRPKAKKPDDTQTICEKEKQKIEARLDRIDSRLSAVEKVDSMQEVTNRSLQQDVADLKEERKNENQDYLNKLSRIEDRIGKMLDLIININSKNNN